MGVMLERISMELGYYSLLSSLVNFEVIFIIIFVASVLWTFGVHFVKLEETRFLSYLGVSSLSASFALIYWFFFKMIFLFLGYHSAPAVYFVLLVFYAPLQFFLNILLGKIVWKTDWKKSSLVWLFLNILLALGILVELMATIIRFVSY